METVVIGRGLGLLGFRLDRNGDIHQLVDFNIATLMRADVVSSPVCTIFSRKCANVLAVADNFAGDIFHFQPVRFYRLPEIEEAVAGAAVAHLL